MTAKADPSKLNPVERLARKRAAARLRQQRCRARKRQGTMSEKKCHDTEQGPVKVTHDQHRTVTSSSSVHVPPRFRAHQHRAHEQYAPLVEQNLHCPSHRPSSSVHPHQSSEPLFKCISFESQRSFEEAHRQSRGGSPPRALVEPSISVITPSSSPPRNPSLAATISSEERSEEHLVPEEEAAVAAMLSLKTGSEKQEIRDCEREQPPASPPRVVRVPLHPEPASVSASKYRVYHHQPQLYRRQEPCRYEVYHEYAPPPPRPHRRTVPAYYRMPAPPMPVPPHYSRGGFYPPPARYVRYEYE